MKTSLRYLLLSALIVCSLFAGRYAQDTEIPSATTTEPEAAEKATLDLDAVKALPIKQLRRFLNERGLTCKGCTDKEEFVQMVFNNQHVPIKPTEPEKSSPFPADGEKIDKAQMDELMAKLRMNGFGGSMFTADDLKNMSPDEMASKFNSGGFQPPKSRRSAGKKSKAEKEETESSGESNKDNEKENKAKDKKSKDNKKKEKAKDNKSKAKKTKENKEKDDKAKENKTKDNKKNEKESKSKDSKAKENKAKENKAKDKKSQKKSQQKPKPKSEPSFKDAETIEL